MIVNLMLMDFAIGLRTTRTNAYAGDWAVRRPYVRLSYYIYAESSAPATAQDKTRLLSKTFSPPTFGRCVRFWYNMFGSGIGELRVYINDALTSSTEKIWVKQRNQGDEWLRGKADILSSNSYKIVFEAVRGPTFQGDIALDDIVFTEDDLCDFGSSKHTYCTWTNDATNAKVRGGYTFDWWWMRAPTPSKNTGPTTDHTSASGYYIYLETSSPFRPGNEARLISKQYQPSAAVCLDFWYHMFGKTIGSLRVYLDDNTARHRIWELKGNQGNVWRKTSVPIESKSPFKLIFEGERGASYTGDIGLDDIAVKSGRCSANIT